MKGWRSALGGAAALTVMLCVPLAAANTRTADTLGATSATAQTTWQVVTIPGLPAGAALGEIWSRASSDVFVWASRTTPTTSDVPESFLFHWNGSAWAQVLSLPGYSPGSVFGTGSSEVIVSVYKCLNGTAAGCGPDPGGHVFRSENGGVTWNEDVLPAAVGAGGVSSLSGTPGNVHAIVGGNYILRFDGTAWSIVFSGFSDDAGKPVALTLLSANEGYFVSCWGWGRWDGSSWAFHGRQFDFCDVNSIWGTRDGFGLHLYTVGNNNFSNGVRVWRFNEATQSFGCKFCYVFSDGSAPFTGGANGVWGSGGNDVYVTGSLPGVEPAHPGRLYHFDGAAWTRVTAIGDIPPPVDIWGTGPQDVWVVLSNSQLLHYAPALANTPPNVSAGGPYSVGEGDSITLSGSGSDPDGDPLTFAWDLNNDGSFADASGDGPTVTSAQLTLLGLGVGTHTIALRVTDSFGAQSTAATTLVIFENAPVAAFTANPNPAGCQQAVTLDASASRHGNPRRTIVAYSWDFGDGASGSGRVTSHAYAAFGSYTARLTVTDDNGTTDSKTLVVEVSQGNQAPIASPGGPYLLAAGDALALDGSGSSDPNAGCGDRLVSLAWDLNNDGSFADASGDGPTVTSAQLTLLGLGVGTHTIALRVTDSFGAQSTAATTLVINSPPSVSAGGPYNVNEGGSVAVSASGSDPEGQALSYAWDLDNNGSFETSGQSVSFSAAGIDAPSSRTIVARATDPGGLSATASTTVNILNVAPAASLGNDGPVDEGSAATISFSGQSDPSAADSVAGFHYAYACDGGSLAGATYAGSGGSASHSCTFDDGPSTHTVRARIIDKDGGFSEYTTVVTVQNVDPALTAAGNQSAAEGANVAFELGSFADPGADSPWAVQVTWGDGSAATTLTRASAGALPAAGHTYDDNGSYTVTVQVTDKDGASDTTSFQVTVANVAPSATFNAPASVDEGSAIGLSLTNPSDPSSADTAAGFEYAFDCGAGFGDLGASASASCATDDNGNRTVKGRIRDKNGGVNEYTATVQVRNVAPTASLGNDGPVDEGSAATISFSGQSDPSAADSVAGFHYAYSCNGASLAGATYASSGTSASTSCSYADNGTYTVRARIIDKDDGFSEYSATVLVNNVAPTITSLTGPTAPLALGTAATLNATWTDPGVLDTQTARWNWGDGTTTTTSAPAGGSETVSDSHTYAAAGVYTVTLTLTDKDGGSATAVFQFVVVYDTGAGFVTGGGWIDSPAGAYLADPSLTGKATFGFVAKYLPGRNTPDGNTEFQFHAAKFNFHSTSYDSLVVSGYKAQYRGSGTVNGTGGYSFILTAYDGKINGGGGDDDKFRIKIVDTATNDVVYDNRRGASDGIDSDPQALGSGSIVIHKS